MECERLFQLMSNGESVITVETLQTILQELMVTLSLDLYMFSLCEGASSGV